MPNLDGLAYNGAMATPTIRDRIKDLRRVRAGDLIPSPKNWRTHPKVQRDALNGVLAQVGYADAILVREVDDGGLEIIDGHLRVEEADPDQEIPVLVLDVSEEEAALLLATHDPLGAMAYPDLDLYLPLIEDLNPDSEAVAALLEAVANNEARPLYEPPALEEAAPERFDTQQALTDVEADGYKAFTKMGEIWMLGDHRLMCGDATKADQVGQLLDGVRPLMMVTDPPWGVSYDPTWREQYDRFERHSTDTIRHDDRIDWNEAWTLFPGDIAYVWHAGWSTDILAAQLRSNRFDLRAQIIWDKQHFTFSRGHYHWGHEPCWYAVRKGKKARWIGDRKQSTIWNIANSNPYGGYDRTHKSTLAAEKPVECMERPIRHHDVPDIYDPFLGSGTTIIAASNLERRCYAMEIEPRYCDVAIRRWEEYTGNTAVLLEAQ